MNSTAQTPAALDLLEDAVHMLRLVPWRFFLLYYLGSIPFALGVLYFYTDMSLSAFAAEHSAQAALSLACLFVWGQFWQAMFAARLHAYLLGNAPQAWSWRQYVAVLMVQTAVAPWAWVVLPISALLLLPWALAVAFFHNITVLGNGTGISLHTLCSTAYRQACLWPRQNIVLLLILSVFRLCVFINVGGSLALLPYLLKILFGIETVFSRHLGSILNITFVLTAWSLTSLCLGPVLKAVYVLRCFYGESLHSGADLQATLKDLRLTRSVSAVLCAALLLWSPATRAVAQQPASPLVADLTPQLDQAIGEVLQQREYVWRLPRSQAELLPASLPLFPQVSATLKAWLKTFATWCRAAIDWLQERLFKPPPQESAPAPGMPRATTLLWGMGFVVLLLLLVLAWRLWCRRSQGGAAAVPAGLTATPVLADEGLTADVLAAQEWGNMAQHLWQQGDWRLAIRALHLASLAYLAGQHLLTITAAKSNRDYARELGRRAHARPQLLGAFAQNISTFERVWYGTHLASHELVQQFHHTYERIQACVDA